MNTLIQRTAAGAALALAILPFAAIATASHAESARVKVGDLTQAEAVAAFDRQLDSVAASLCAHDIRDLSQDAKACRQAVREEAIAKLSVSQRQELAASTSAPTQIARMGQ